MTGWSIRNLLNPVVTRLLIYGVNPIDVEYVVAKVESMNHNKARSLENGWIAQWQQKADHYRHLADTASDKGRRLSAAALYRHASHCCYAIFLINSARRDDTIRYYQQYGDLFMKAAVYCGSIVNRIDIPLGGGAAIAGHLHRPSAGTPQKKICAVIFSGLGSCKEEMHTLVEPLLERGVTVFVPDMPGSGESLFSRGIFCSIEAIGKSVTAIADCLTGLPELDGYLLGTYGLCMGGGYAFRAAAVDSRYNFCATLFPLLITKVPEGSTPQWMKKSDMALFQRGDVTEEEFLTGLRLLEDGSIDCPFLFIHSRHDNWMPFERSLEFYERARGPKEQLLIETEPVFSSGQAVTHTMPVGEQLHWVRHAAADWIADTVNPLPFAL